LPALSENLKMDDEVPRCPRCGRRVSFDASACDACGYQLIPHRTRAHCKHCGRRIPADAATCPRCGADRTEEIARAGRPSTVRRVARVGVLVFAALLLLCCGWVVFRALTTNTLARAFGLFEPIRTPTRFVEVIYVVATTPAPTPTNPPTATATANASATPTRRGARKQTPTPVGPTLPAGFYAAPILVAPANATVYQGASSAITLQWQPVSAIGLREDEWYFVSISFTASDGSQGSRTGWSKETHWDVPNDWWSEAASDARSFKWTVSVMRIDGADPTTTSSRTLASPNSVVRLFIWN